MTGVQYAEEVLRRLSGGNISDDFEVKLEDLFITIDNAMKDSLVQYSLNVNPNLNGGWVITYECQNLIEECGCHGQVWYWDCPIDILQLPEDGGIILVRNRYYAEYSRVPVAIIPNVIGIPAGKSSKLYWVDGKRLYFTKKDVIFVSLIPTAKDAQELAVPAGYSQIFENLVWEQATKFFQVNKDVSNDSQMTSINNNK